MFWDGSTETAQRDKEISAERIAQELRHEFNRLLDTYLAGEATVAEVRRLNQILEDNVELVDDFHNQVEAHIAITRHVEEKKAAMEAQAREAGFADLPPARDDTEPRLVPLIGPERPRVIVRVVAADLQMQPYHWN